MKFKQPLLVAALAAALVLLPTAAFAASPTSSPSPTATNAALNPVRNIKLVKGSDAHSAVLTWSAPSGVKASAKQQYFVNTTVTLGKKKLNSLTETGTTKLKLTYTSIPAGAQLKSEVETLDRYATGKHDYSAVYTQPQVLPGSVSNAMAIATGVELKTTWSAPSTTAGTLIDAYRLTAYQVDLTSGKKTKGPTTTLKSPKSLSYTFKKLKAQTNYYVFIEAHNSKGYGKVAQTNNVMTGADLTATSSPSATPTSTTSSAPSATPTDTASTPVATDTATTGPTPQTSNLPNPEVTKALTSNTDTQATINAAKSNLALMQLIVIGVLVLFLAAVAFFLIRFLRRG